MIKEIKYPYNKLTNLERERVELFQGYHACNNNDIHVYYIPDFELGAGYDIIVSLHKFKNISEVKLDDVTKNITDIDNELNTY